MWQADRQPARHAHHQPVLTHLLEPAPRDRLRGGDPQVGSDRPAEASTPLREGRDLHRRRTLGPPPVGVAADHEADAALGSTEPGLEGERGRAGHGRRPSGKTGLDKHARVVAGV
jgi:hypothetical protein